MTDQEVRDALCAQIRDDLLTLECLAEENDSGDRDAGARFTRLMNAAEIKLMFVRSLAEADPQGNGKVR